MQSRPELGDAYQAVLAENVLEKSSHKQFGYLVPPFALSVWHCSEKKDFLKVQGRMAATSCCSAARGSQDEGFVLALLRASSPGISIDAFGRLKPITIVSVVVVIPFDSIIVIFSLGFVLGANMYCLRTRLWLLEGDVAAVFCFMIGVLIFDLVSCATILGISDGDVLVRAVEIFFVSGVLEYVLAVDA